VAAFLALDWFGTAAIEWAAKSKGAQGTCRVHDSVRHHALQPNCSTKLPWGGDSYEFFTNSLGFRDEKIRDVPLSGVRPRVLLLGDSFTESPIAWHDSYVGRIAAHLPQYDFLNGGVLSYSPSNYLNVARMVLAKRVEIDEVIVFIDISDTQDEAALYSDVDASGAVTTIDEKRSNLPTGTSWYGRWRLRIARHLMITNSIFEFFERYLVNRGYYHLYPNVEGDVFDRERSAWTYRKVDETDRFFAGYAPLGVEGGIAKEKAKMTLLWEELERHGVPLSVVVYPWPAQIVHDTPDSRQVLIWRDWCQGKCRRFISLFPQFFAVKDQCPRTEPGCWYPRYFIPGDIHYNAAGSALVADAIIISLTEAPPTKLSRGTAKR